MSRSIPRLPEIGDGTLAILRRAGIRTALDLVQNRNRLQSIPGIGPAREAVLLEWAERMLSENDLIQLLEACTSMREMAWTAQLADKTLLDDAKARFNLRTWHQAATVNWRSLEELEKLDQSAERGLPPAERSRLRKRIRPRIAQLQQERALRLRLQRENRAIAWLIVTVIAAFLLVLVFVR